MVLTDRIRFILPFWIVSSFYFLIPFIRSPIDAPQTFINIDYIQAIESGDYSVFPARIFAIQYFRKYAGFLGLKLEFFDIYNSA